MISSRTLHPEDVISRYRVVGPLGAAVAVARFQGDEIAGIHWSRDGNSVVVNAGKRSSDAVLIRKFRGADGR